TIRITNARYDRTGIRDVVADGDAAGLVHRGAAHPTKIAGGCEGPLLTQHWRCGREGLTRGIRQFIPTDAHARATRYRMVDHECFARSEIAIAQSIHESISEGIKLVRSSRLRNAGAAATGPTKSCDS